MNTSPVTSAAVQGTQQLLRRTRSASRNAKMPAAPTRQQRQEQHVVTAEGEAATVNALPQGRQQRKRRLAAASAEAHDVPPGAAQQHEAKLQQPGPTAVLPAPPLRCRRSRAAGAPEPAQATGDGVAHVDELPKLHKQTAKAAPGAPSRQMEDDLREQGYVNVAGVDEAGRGPLAGPVVVAACVVPPGVEVPGVRDSKQMSEQDREQVYEHIKSDPRIKWAVSVIGHEQIDRENILQATLTGMRQALNSLAAGTTGSGQEPGNSSACIAAAAQPSSGGQCDVHYALIDGNRLPKDLPCPALAVVKGDGRCVCIAAASVIAKVTRDRIMQQYHLVYPLYGFDLHKAYGVPAHMRAIHQHGPCPIHRRSFEPTKSITGWSREPAAAKKSKKKAS